MSVVGILPACVSMLMKPLGIAAQHDAYPWARAQALVQDGAADGFCTTPTAQHQRYAIFTDLPVLVPKLAVFYRRIIPVAWR